MFGAEHLLDASDDIIVCVISTMSFFWFSNITVIMNIVILQQALLVLKAWSCHTMQYFIINCKNNEGHISGPEG